MRISIVVNKTLEAGEKANVSAIIMGQLGHDMPVLYMESVEDASGMKHAGITANVVILDGKEGQLLTLAKQAREKKIKYVLFSCVGQAYSNNYGEYKNDISSLNTESTKIVGVGVCGNEEEVKILTKKFSLAK